MDPGTIQVELAELVRLLLVGCVSFPLTLALPLGEGTSIPSCDESRRSGLAKARRTILPLPLGEGRGEWPFLVFSRNGKAVTVTQHKSSFECERIILRITSAAQDNVCFAFVGGGHCHPAFSFEPDVHAIVGIVNYSHPSTSSGPATTSLASGAFKSFAS